MKIKPRKMDISKRLMKRIADPSNNGGDTNTALKNSILNMLLATKKLLMDFFVNYRIISLVIFAFLGLVLYIFTYILLFESTEFPKINDLSRNSLSLLVLGLPTFFILWIFRTHDVQRQIDNSTFFECTRLLASEEKTISKKTALEQLVYLRQKNSSYRERVDSLTRGIPLEKVVLNFAQLNDINLSNADLTGADLTGANLTDADLIRTNLTDANLTDANLTDADLTGADLTGADLTDAKLGVANLTDTYLNNAKLIGAYLFWTNLNGADLTGADLTGTYLNNADLRGVRYDENTKFPPDFDPHKAGCIKINTSQAHQG